MYAYYAECVLDYYEYCVLDSLIDFQFKRTNLDWLLSNKELYSTSKPVAPLDLSGNNTTKSVIVRNDAEEIQSV